jgi:zinc D-Ala-D-Ala carboxypeptidase
MVESFVLRLDELRERVNRPLTVLSGYRCPEHNNVVSSTGLEGPHTKGVAADIQCAGAGAHSLLTSALVLGFVGIGVQQKGGEMGARYLHLDMVLDGPRPNVWSY